MRRRSSAVTKSGAEVDVVYNRRIYAYLQRSGVVAGIKRQLRRRFRRVLRREPVETD